MVTQKSYPLHGKKKFLHFVLAIKLHTKFKYFTLKYNLTSQKNSLPLKPQNQAIQDTSSELLIFSVRKEKYLKTLLYKLKIMASFQFKLHFSYDLITLRNGYKFLERLI